MTPFRLTSAVAVALFSVACATPPSAPPPAPPSTSAEPPVETTTLATAASPPPVVAAKPLGTPPIPQGTQTERAKICPEGKYADAPVTQTKAALVKDGFVFVEGPVEEAVEIPSGRRTG